MVFNQDKILDSDVGQLWMNITINHTKKEYNSTTATFVSPLDMYLPPFLIVIGTFCNFLVIKVMRSFLFRSVSTSVFITLTSGMDIVSLLILLSVHWINANFTDVIYRGENAHIMCKIFNFMGWLTSDLGIVLTAAMTTERALAILFPMKAPKWCTVKRAKHTCLFATFAVIIKDFHFVITSDITPDSRTDLLCFVSPNIEFYKIFWTQVWPWLHNGFLCIAFLIVIVSNIIIIKNVRLADKIFNSKLSEIKRNIVQHPSYSQPRGYSKRRQIAIMLLIASFTIIICTLPFSIFTTVDSKIQFLNDNVDEQKRKHLISSVCFYLLYVNRCGNFFLYCISGTRFRRSLKRIFCYSYDKTILSDNNQLISGRTASRQKNVPLSLSRDSQILQHIFSRNTDFYMTSTRF